MASLQSKLFSAIGVLATAVLPFHSTQHTIENNYSFLALHHQPQEVQMKIIEEALQTLRKYDEGNLESDDVPSSYMRRKYQFLANQEQTMELSDIIGNMALGGRDEVYEPEERKWANLLTKSDLDRYWSNPITRQERQIRAFEDSLMVNVSELALMHDNMSLDDIIRKSLKITDRSMIDWNLYNWSQFDWNTHFTIEDEIQGIFEHEQMKGGAGIVYLMNNTKTALTMFDMYEHLPPQYHYSDARTREVHRISRIVKNIKSMRQEILENYDESVPLGYFAFAIGSYFGGTQNAPPVSVTETSQNSFRANKQNAPLEVTLQKLTAAAIPHLSSMYKDKVDSVVISERGATLFGKVLERLFHHIPDENRIPVKYFKFGRKGKLVEAYSLTDEFAEMNPKGYSIDDTRSILSEIRGLREEFTKARKEENIQEAKLLKSRIEELEDTHEDLYEQIYPRVFKEQMLKAGQAIGRIEGGKAKAYDDHIISGSTSQNIVEVLGTLGYDVNHDDIIPIMDSRANENGNSLIRDPLGLGEDYAFHSWRETNPTKTDIDLSGIVYGMDKETIESSELFRRRRNLQNYSLTPPARGIYDVNETLLISADILRKTLLIGEEESIHENAIGKYNQLIGILNSYQRKETSFDAVEKKVNSWMVRTHREYIRNTVDKVVKEWESKQGKSFWELIDSGIQMENSYQPLLEEDAFIPPSSIASPIS